MHNVQEPVTGGPYDRLQQQAEAGRTPQPVGYDRLNERLRNPNQPVPFYMQLTG